MLSEANVVSLFSHQLPQLHVFSHFDWCHSVLAEETDLGEVSKREFPIQGNDKGSFLVSSDGRKEIVAKGQTVMKGREICGGSRKGWEGMKSQLTAVLGQDDICIICYWHFKTTKKFNGKKFYLSVQWTYHVNTIQITWSKVHHSLYFVLHDEIVNRTDNSLITNLFKFIVCNTLDVHQPCLRLVILAFRKTIWKDQKTQQCGHLHTNCSLKNFSKVGIPKYPTGNKNVKSHSNARKIFYWNGRARWGDQEDVIQKREKEDEQKRKEWNKGKKN